MAILFKSCDEEYCLVTNYKVMYSTLTHQPNLRIFGNGSLQELLDFSGRKYLIVRNPYHRLESFYRDKFVIGPRASIYPEKWGWQLCQQLFFDEFTIDTQSFAAIRQALMATTFDEFISYLPSKFMFDGHLQPQVLAVKDDTVVRQVAFEGILQMEKETHMAFLARELNIDTSKRYNETASLHTRITWSAQAREIVNRLYKKDFEQLGYEILDN